MGDSRTKRTGLDGGGASQGGGNVGGGSKKRRVGSGPPREKVEIPGMTLSKVDSAPQLMLSRDLKEVTGEKGYRMVRAIDGVVQGNWYWECEILDTDKADAHFRLGWSQKPGDLQAPVGYDKYSYGYRDVAGSRVHMSVREDGYGEPYGPGDVIGFLICLPVLPEHLQELHGRDSAAMPLYAPKGSGGVIPRSNDDGGGDGGERSMDPVLAAELEFLGNHIRFFKNGVDQGVAYRQIPGAKYYPAISIYMGGRVRVNFGPRWICDPVKSGCCIPFKSISELREPLKKDDRKAYEASIRGSQQTWRARRGAVPFSRSSSVGSTPSSNRDDEEESELREGSDVAVDTEESPQKHPHTTATPVDATHGSLGLKGDGQSMSMDDAANMDVVVKEEVYGGGGGGVRSDMDACEVSTINSSTDGDADLGDADVTAAPVEPPSEAGGGDAGRGGAIAGPVTLNSGDGALHTGSGEQSVDGGVGAANAAAGKAVAGGVSGVGEASHDGKTPVQSGDDTDAQGGKGIAISADKQREGRSGDGDRVGPCGDGGGAGGGGSGGGVVRAFEGVGERIALATPTQTPENVNTPTSAIDVHVPRAMAPVKEEVSRTV